MLSGMPVSGSSIASRMKRIVAISGRYRLLSTSMDINASFKTSETVLPSILTSNLGTIISVDVVIVLLRACYQYSNGTISRYWPGQISSGLVRLFASARTRHSVEEP